MINIDKSRDSRGLLIYVLAIFFVIVLVLPIGTLFVQAFFLNGEFVGLSNFITYFSTSALFTSFKNSIFVSSITSVFVVFFAFIFAYSIERSNIRFKKLLNFIALLPLFIPTMTHAIALIYLFGENGVISTGFFGAIPSLAFTFPLYGQWGVILAEAIYVFPAVYIMSAIALKSCDYRLYEAAEIMGTSKKRIFTTITLPSVKNTIISSFFASFTMVFSDFGIPKVLGGNYSLLATDIYKQVIGQSNITMGATVGILLIIPSIISFIVERKISKNVTSVDSNASEFKINKDKIRDNFVGVITYAIAIFIIVIFTTVIVAAFIEQWPYNLSFTTKWFNINVVGSTPIQILLSTVFVASISAILGTIIAILAAYVTERGTGFNKVRNLINLMGTMPLAIPGLVIGLSYLLFFNGAENVMKFMYGTFIIMIFANIVHFFSVPYITLKESMKKIDKEYENVSETMGIPWYYVFDNVILPISKPAIIESFQYYFLNSTMTVSALIFLYTTKTKVASVQMVATYDEGYIASTAAIAVTILALNLVVKYCIEMYKLKCKKDKRDKDIEIFKIVQSINEEDGLSSIVLSDKLSLSTFRVNSLIRECIKKELICKKTIGNKIQYEVTEKGFELLRANIGAIKEDRLLISKDSSERVKTAVILAAGQREDFDVSPAGLPLGEKTVLEEAIKKLELNGINKIVIVLGYGKEKILKILKDKVINVSKTEIIVVESNTYKESGSMDSLALVSKYINEDFILVEGDLVFESRAIKELINSEKRECALITELSYSGDEEFIQLKNNCIFKLGKDIHSFNRVDGEFVGIMKISYKLFELMIKEYKENMNPLLNYEYILLDVARDFKVSCLKVNNLRWNEIDNNEQYSIIKYNSMKR